MVHLGTQQSLVKSCFQEVAEHANSQVSSTVLVEGKELQQPEVSLPAKSSRHKQLGGKAGKDDGEEQECARA